MVTPDAPSPRVPRSRTPLCLGHVEFTISMSFALRNLAYQQLTHSFLPFALTFVFLQVPSGVLYHTKYRCWINSPVFNKGTFVRGWLHQMLLGRPGHPFALRVLSISQMVVSPAKPPSLCLPACISANDPLLGLFLKGG